MVPCMPRTAAGRFGCRTLLLTPPNVVGLRTTKLDPGSTARTGGRCRSGKRRRLGEFINKG